MAIQYIYIFIHQNGSQKKKNKKYIHTKIYNKQKRNIYTLFRQSEAAHMEEIPALFDNYYVRAFQQLH